jgi:hypothetical protein
LIFLTNISWIFFLFLFCYFFFVLFFLPTFYKKVRSRALVRSNQQRVVLILIANSVIGTLLMLCDVTRSYFLSFSALLSTLSFKGRTSAVRKPTSFLGLSSLSTVPATECSALNNITFNRPLHLEEGNFVELRKSF